MKKLPIGYYLKLADKCLTNGIDEIQARHQINRTEWQVLNSISEQISISKEEIIKLMAPFAGPQSLEDVLFHLSTHKLIDRKENRITLSAEGVELHKACLATQQEFRNMAMNGISETDYKVSISTLQRIINNCIKTNYGNEVG
ncbi:MAG: hypothetical protein ABL895_05955 [Cyclobacteriaceae bacterium]